MSSPLVKVAALKGTQVFQPIKLGKNELSSKIIFAPTTRFRALDDHTPSDLNLEHYDDRTKYKGTFVITEATFVSEQAAGYPNVPGIWKDSHVKAWRKITDQVHKNGSFIALQGWFLGRLGKPGYLKEHGQDLIGPSAIYQTEEQEKEAIAAGNPLRPLTEQEIHDLVHVTYTKAAKNAIEAGFDYFELHGAHGYLLDSFLHSSSNQRTDKYGGSIENRARFILELVDHLIEVIGADKLAIRLSPWAKLAQSPENDNSAYTTFSYLLHELQKRANQGNQLAYISIVEPRVNGSLDIKVEDQIGSNDFANDIWKGTFVKAGNYTYDAPSFKTLLKDIEDGRTLVGFSRYFISNPDLVQRLHDGTDLNAYDRDLFYIKGNWGYNTYTASGESRKFDEETETKRTQKEIAV